MCFYGTGPAERGGNRRAVEEGGSVHHLSAGKDTAPPFPEGPQLPGHYSVMRIDLTQASGGGE